MEIEVAEIETNGVKKKESIERRLLKLRGGGRSY